MRIIIYTGKGGVGKTGMAAATACKIAKTGKKVLIMSTDQAHSLGDVFEHKIGREQTKITQNLYAVEIDTVYEGEKSWGNLKGYLKDLFSAKSSDGIEIEELLVFPGLEELFSMFQILDVYESGIYDTLIVDCAPTGETLALLKYPERLSNLIEKVLPIEKLGVKTVGPAIEKIMKVPMPKEEVFDDIESLMDKMKRLQALMLDKTIVSLRVVTTPERIVLQEAKRNFTCLYLYHYNVDAVLVNRIYPKEAMEGYFGKWMQIQEAALEEIKQCFGEVPRFYIELQKSELRTLPIVEALGDRIFKDCDPDDVLFCDTIYETDYTAKTLRIHLPFARKEDLTLEQREKELVAGVQNEIRRFPMPTEFLQKEITGAKFEQGYLTIFSHKNGYDTS